jgi:hypothetical protein
MADPCRHGPCDVCLGPIADSCTAAILIGRRACDRVLFLLKAERPPRFNLSEIIPLGSLRKCAPIGHTPIRQRPLSPFPQTKTPAPRERLPGSK